MLTRIELRHFKCFTLLKLPLRPLTLLSGANASGKSSVMQALVLLHQTMREHEWSSRLMLNGEAIRLGTVADVIDQVHGRRSVGIGLLDGEMAYRWEFTGERAEMSMAVTSASFNGFEGDDPAMLRHLLPWSQGDEAQAGSLPARLCNLTYLTAERMGPRETYPLKDRQHASVVGPRGEHAVSVLYSGRDERVMDSLVIRDAPPTLLRQVEARMSSVFAGCELTVEKVRQADAVTLGLRTSKSMDFHRPAHTGFGLTQVLPMVVAALSASEESVLLVENPEVHLHPAGQAAMGEFLTEVAAAGVQVIVETHSDHVLNGIRRAVKNGTLVPDDAALHFFRLRPVDDQERRSRGWRRSSGLRRLWPRPVDDQDYIAQVQSPALDRDGNIDRWPEGFFDQFDKDMNYFAGWS